jgi:heme exporter protein C
MEDRVIAVGRASGIAALVLVPLWLAMVVFVAPVEAVQGIVQKIFYVHVACILPAYTGFVLTAVGGIGFLATRREEWDRLALAGAEVGVLFTTFFLIVGPLWAKPVWGHWWVWDLRLTLTLVLWFVYVAYLFLRAFTVGSDAARSFASVYGIAGTAVIPFVYYAVELARGSTLHPSNPASEGLPGAMAWTAIAGLVAFVALFLFLLALRLDVARLEARVDDAEVAV